MRHLGLALLLMAIASGAAAQPLTPELTAFRAIYKEMVETDTSDTTGACTNLVRPIAARLRAAGYPAADVHVVIPENAPNDGNVVAVLPGSDPALGALVLLAHIDVVDARREDWVRDPFKLIEENGFFYGRGAADDKSMAAVFLDQMIRLKTANTPHRRTVKLVLTCGEETSATTVNGLRYLVANRPDLVKGALALNEGAGGRLDRTGKPLALEVQSGEKVHQVWALEVTNPGGHSSIPRPDNAIYQLSEAVKRIQAYSFPVRLNEVTRGFLQKMGPLEGGEGGRAMTALAANPADARAAAIVSARPEYNAILHTTCVATRLDAGHAANALPQRATATFSCRALPGQSSAEVKAELARVIADPAVKFTLVNGEQPSPPAPPLSRELMGPVEAAAARIWPGLPIVPVMLASATDGRFLNSAGTPTYGLSGMFSIAGETNAHGLDEKIRVKSLYEGRQFLDAVIRDYIR